MEKKVKYLCYLWIASMLLVGGITKIFLVQYGSVDQIKPVVIFVVLLYFCPLLAIIHQYTKQTSQTVIKHASLILLIQHILWIVLALFFPQ